MVATLDAIPWKMHKKLHVIHTFNCLNNVQRYLALTKLFLSKHNTLSKLLVVHYNPSHANKGNEVHAPLKIFSILIRCLNNELLPEQIKDMNPLERIKEIQEEQKYDEDRMEVEDDEGS